jgi:hypothetical protein
METVGKSQELHITGLIRGTAGVIPTIAWVD